MNKSKEAGTPLSQWYTRYKTLRERELLMEASEKEKVSELYFFFKEFYI